MKQLRMFPIQKKVQYQVVSFEALDWMYKSQLALCVDITYIGKYGLILELEDGTFEEWHVGPYVLKNVSRMLKAVRKSNRSFLPIIVQLSYCDAININPNDMYQLQSFWGSECFASEKEDDITTYYIYEGDDLASTPIVFKTNKVIVAINNDKAYWTTNVA